MLIHRRGYSNLNKKKKKIVKETGLHRSISSLDLWTTIIISFYVCINERLYEIKSIRFSFSCMRMFKFAAIRSDYQISLI